MARSNRQNRMQMVLLSLVSIGGTLALFGAVPLLADLSAMMEPQTTASPPAASDVQAN
ncbi:MAG: hypothetical protein AAFY26_12940 [Cyanobacteria bacterium J06638_22]